ncbi:hypothetical protein SteCoe_18794 [Stentor coeruleus]|uniref:Enkurin domain-containing protein n=1 Tax=Stentor coeruleus TaxID=5963 RepID=A0A1R2BW84_9CILI|nr:hypothetical protein SteCoe_18794 [Stentor coeruleus]
MDAYIKILPYEKDSKAFSNPISPKDYGKNKQPEHNNKEKPLIIGPRRPVIRFYNQIPDLQIVSTRVPSDQMPSVKNPSTYHHRYTANSASNSENRNFEETSQQASFKRNPHIKFSLSPGTINYTRTQQNQLQEKSTKKLSESFDKTWESTKKSLNKKTIFTNQYNKTSSRNAPARYLPISEIRPPKKNMPIHLAARSLEKDLKLLVENNYERLNKDFLIEKMSRIRERTRNKMSILKEKDDESWKWDTPEYSPNDKKAVHFD